METKRLKYLTRTSTATWPDKCLQLPQGQNHGVLQVIFLGS